MSIENIADEYRKSVLKEAGFTSDLFVTRFLFFIYIESGYTLDEIEDNLKHLMGVKSVTRQTLESWRKLYEKKQFTIADKRAGRVRGSSDYNKNIVSTFAKGQFSSAREMHRCTGVPLSTICYNLNQSGMRYVHFRKVPYILSEEMKALRVEYAQTMLDILEKQKQHNFMDILTMDETPLYLQNDNLLGWVSEDDPIPEVTKPTLHKKKFTLSVMWGVGGTVVVKGLDGENRVNSEYFCKEILTEAIRWCENKRYHTGVSSYLFHMDNAPCHNSRQTKDFMKDHHMNRMVHPPYSPDLAPCDFFLFGYMKREFADAKFGNMEEAVIQITTWLDTIDKNMRLAVFENWMLRLQKCIECNGDYVQSTDDLSENRKRKNGNSHSDEKSSLKAGVKKCKKK